MNTRSRKVFSSSRRTTVADYALFNLFVSQVGYVSPTEALNALQQPHPSAVVRRPKNVLEYKRAQFAFKYLLTKEYIAFDQQGPSLVIHLTDKGKRKVEMRRLGDMVVHPRAIQPAEWDGKWRLVLFDIPAKERAKRNAFRTFIRRLGAVMLQKSVWAYPYDFRKEINQLAEFFSLSQNELRIVVATDVAGDETLLKHFKLKLK